MLDVLHYLLDEDFSVTSADQIKARSHIRTTLYSNLYNRKYRYAYIENSDGEFISEQDMSSFPTGGARSTEVKPYIPPTYFNPDDPNPFKGSLREAPMG